MKNQHTDYSTPLNGKTVKIVYFDITFKFHSVKKLFTIIMLISLFACTSRVETNQLYTITDLPLDSVKSEVWFPELMAVNTKTMTCINSKLCMIRPNEESIIYLVDENSGEEIGYFGGIGIGPGEVSKVPVLAGTSPQGDTLYIHDFNARDMKIYHLNTEKEPVSFKFVYKKQLANPLIDGLGTGYFTICRLENGYYVGLSGLCHGNLFNLLDSDLNIIKSFGGFPLDGLVTDGSNLNMTLPFNGTLVAHGNSIYYSAYKFGYMARYDITDDIEIKLVWENFYSKTDYRIDNRQVKFGSDNQHGFSGMAIGEKYIFTTFSGIPTQQMYNERSAYAVDPKTLVVIRHDGKPVGRFKLDSRSFSLALSEDEKYLYVNNIDPEVQIERFLVSDLLEKLHD